MGLLGALQQKIKYLTSPRVYVTVKQSAPNSVLLGRNIIVTGGSRGLGYSIAKRCVDEGGNVLITGRDETVLERASKAIGSTCSYLKFDVRNFNSFASFLDEAVVKFNGEKIDSLVSNAGVSFHEGNFRNVTLEGWDQQFDTNLKGNYFLVVEFIKYLEKQEDKSGNIVVITSERSKRADDIPYGLTKVATNSFIQAISSNVIAEGIRINGVAPGVTATDMTGYSSDGDMFSQRQPTKRIFCPEEVAEVVNFLLNDVSACINGEIIACDQGRYIAHW